MKYWIFLHHKCASQYLRAAISAAGQAAGRLTSISALNSMEEAPDENSVVLAHVNSDYSLDDNAWPEILGMFDKYMKADDWRGIHFVRDPRDLLVSAYWAHRISHPLNFPRLRAHREALQQVDLETGLLLEMDFYLTKAAMEHILDWPEHPSVITVDAIEAARGLAQGDSCDHRRGWRIWAALNWIDIHIDPLPAAPTWQQLTGRQPGEEDNTHHYRHGVRGDHVRYFTRAVREEFDRRYGEAMAAKGYR